MTRCRVKSFSMMAEAREKQGIFSCDHLNNWTVEHFFTIRIRTQLCSVIFEELKQRLRDSKCAKNCDGRLEKERNRTEYQKTRQSEEFIFFQNSNGSFLKRKIENLQFFSPAIIRVSNSVFTADFVEADETSSGATLVCKNATLAYTLRRSESGLILGLASKYIKLKSALINIPPEILGKAGQK